MNEDDDVRDLFRAARPAAAPSDAARERVRAAIDAAGGAPPPGSGGAPHSPIVGGLVIVAILLGGGYALVRRRSASDAAPIPTTSASAIEVTNAESAAPSGPAPEASAEPLESAAPATPATRAAAPPARASADEPSDEITLLQRARLALNQGDAAGALALLDTHAQRFPKSMLGQERTVTRIQALCRLGRTSEARPLAERLEASSPRSPHLAALKGACPSLAK